MASSWSISPCSSSEPRIAPSLSSRESRTRPPLLRTLWRPWQGRALSISGSGRTPQSLWLCGHDATEGHNNRCVTTELRRHFVNFVVNWRRWKSRNLSRKSRMLHSKWWSAHTPLVLQKIWIDDNGSLNLTNPLISLTLDSFQPQHQDYGHNFSHLIFFCFVAFLFL